MPVSILGGGYTVVKKKHNIPAFMNLTVCVQKI